MKEEQWEAASGPPLAEGRGPTNAAMGGVGAGVLCSQCLTFFSSGGKVERT